MTKLTDKQMKEIYAEGISGTYINSLVRAASLFVDIGRYFGSSIRRFVNGNLCRY